MNVPPNGVNVSITDTDQLMRLLIGTSQRFRQLSEAAEKRLGSKKEWDEESVHELIGMVKAMIDGQALLLFAVAGVLQQVGVRVVTPRPSLVLPHGRG